MDLELEVQRLALVRRTTFLDIGKTSKWQIHAHGSFVQKPEGTGPFSEIIHG